MKLVNHISGTQVVDGFTLTGGDPLVQSEALAQLLPKLSEITDDILVYTGFDFDTVKSSIPS
jgi:anaerobic ribonucleoside-triphosphate reductase activating protein